MLLPIKKHLWKTTIIIVLFVCTAIATQRQEMGIGDLSPQEIARRTLDSVVFVIAKDKNGKAIGQGSGFYYAPRSIITSYHVIKDAEKVYISAVASPDVLHECNVDEADQSNDLVILHPNKADGPPLKLSQSPTSMGERVYVIGNPRGLGGTLSEGLISSYREIAGRSFIQHSAPVSSGSSGSPMLNTKGEVIGIVISMIRDSQNLNFAVHAQFADILIKQAAEKTLLKILGRKQPDSDSLNLPSNMNQMTVSELQAELYALQKQYNDLLRASRQFQREFKAFLDTECKEDILSSDLACFKHVLKMTRTCNELNAFTYSSSRRIQ
jgi:S1-C subfamily serine protease